MAGTGIALTDKVIRAWDSIVSYSRAGTPASKTGAGSTSEFRKALTPVRESLRKAIQRRLTTVPAFSDLTVRLSVFWQGNPKGALLKDHIWSHAARTKEKTEGRLQVTLTPDNAVRSEYVAYPVTDPKRRFHIQDIADWIRDPNWFQQFRQGCASIPRGFCFWCLTGNSERIEAYTDELTNGDWDKLRHHGVSPDDYFVIALDRPRDALRCLTVDEFAELVVADWCELSGIYPLLQGHAATLKPPCIPPVSPDVRGVRRTTTPPSTRTFAPEFAGTPKEYEVRGPIQASRYHARVVNALAEAFEAQGIRTSSDQPRDLYLLDGNGLPRVLFEVKADTSKSSVYKGVGQLLLNGAPMCPAPRMVLVVPGEPWGDSPEALRQLNIDVLKYGWEKGQPTFSELSGLISSLT